MAIAVVESRPPLSNTTARRPSLAASDSGPRTARMESHRNPSTTKPQHWNESMPLTRRRVPRRMRVPNAARKPADPAMAVAPAPLRPDGLVVGEAAREMKCAVRTIWRDLAVMQEAGLPIYDERAPDGRPRVDS